MDLFLVLAIFVFGFLALVGLFVPGMVKDWPDDARPSTTTKKTYGLLTLRLLCMCRVTRMAKDETFMEKVLRPGVACGSC